MRITTFCMCIALFVASCATGGIELPEKYVLDDQLESVPDISKYQGYTSWDAVDSQSLILQTSPSNYYLIVLQTRASELRFSEAIRISSSGSRVRAGMDTVTVLRRSVKGPPYRIEKIYRLKGREQVQTIREQIRAAK